MAGQRQFGAAHAGVGLKGDAAEQAEQLGAFPAAELVPGGVSRQTGDGGDQQQDSEVQLAHGRQRPGRNQQRSDEERQPQALSERGEEHPQGSVADYQMKIGVHDANSLHRGSDGRPARGGLISS